ncbi:MAG: hypothetical protein B0W54_09945 [Cellvibrio sp. 79]|nr:MAG: hypothetical protein B0W54_09945 [Cellvibrio sp. 79]
MLKNIILIATFLAASIAFGEDKNEIPLLVSLERTTCEGGCPVYSLTVFADGNAVFIGKRLTDVQGVKEFKIPQKSVDAIYAELKRVRFLEFNNEYSPKTLDCGIASTDHSTLILKATVENTEKSVSAYLGCHNKKVSDLYELSTFIDNAVGASTLINDNEKIKSE